jgi:hypothetical protein
LTSPNGATSYKWWNGSSIVPLLEVHIDRADQNTSGKKSGGDGANEQDEYRTNNVRNIRENSCQ